MTDFSDIDEADRQLVIRGLAVQSLHSPGLDFACRNVSIKLAGVAMYDKFRTLLADTVEPCRRS